MQRDEPYFMDENYYLENENISDDESRLVEMDEVTILQGEKAKTYSLEDDSIKFENEKDHVKFLYTPAVSSSLAIYADLSGNSDVKLLAHITPKQSLSQTILLMNTILLKNSLMKDQVLNFYIFGGTKESIQFSNKKDGEHWLFPASYQGKKKSLIVNVGASDEASDDEFQHIFVLPNEIKIYQYSPEEKILKTYSQALNLNEKPVLLETIDVSANQEESMSDVEFSDEEKTESPKPGFFQETKEPAKKTQQQDPTKNPFKI